MISSWYAFSFCNFTKRARLSSSSRVLSIIVEPASAVDCMFFRMNDCAEFGLGKEYVFSCVPLYHFNGF